MTIRPLCPVAGSIDGRRIKHLVLVPGEGFRPFDLSELVCCSFGLGCKYFKKKPATPPDIIFGLDLVFQIGYMSKGEKTKTPSSDLFRPHQTPFGSGTWGPVPPHEIQSLLRAWIPVSESKIRGGFTLVFLNKTSVGVSRSELKGKKKSTWLSLGGWHMVHGRCGSDPEGPTGTDVPTIF